MINKFADLHNFNLCRQRGPAPAPAGGATSHLVHCGPSAGAALTRTRHQWRPCAYRSVSRLLLHVPRTIGWWTSLQFGGQVFRWKSIFLKQKRHCWQWRKSKRRWYMWAFCTSSIKKIADSFQILALQSLATDLVIIQPNICSPFLLRYGYVLFLWK